MNIENKEENRYTYYSNNVGFQFYGILDTHTGVLNTYKQPIDIVNTAFIFVYIDMVIRRLNDDYILYMNEVENYINESSTGKV